ncbi:CU044_5270 family protein [Actinoplanes sp. NBC_00393]|uniref:CU044_5270 family protein n=1 Tax=Actinoplanes sp. NBC_00393 TaxID=2975953 RepID=UPI002E24EE8E
MDEITLTRELGEETALPGADRLAPARARLLAEIAPPREGKRRTGRWLLAGTTAIAGTAAAVAVLALPGAPAPEPSAPPATTAPTPKLAPVAAFLDQAAIVAGQAADTIPRDDQYLYIRTTDPDGRRSESWLSIDGERDSKGRDQKGDWRVYPGCVDGRTVADDGKTEVGCEPVRRYRPDMPAEPKAMAAWLKAFVRAEAGEENLDGIGKYIGAFSWEFWMRPGQRAALYRAIGMFDGIRLVEDVRDGRGRDGVGVAWASPGTDDERVLWVFDPRTHRLLGTTETSIEKIAVVDRIGQTG